MIIKNKYKISKDSDLLFAKIDILNTLKKEKKEYMNFFSFAIMELGTNILKYAKIGEIWLLKENDEFLLAALDEEGIDDISWAIKKGTSSRNSLGLGLYQLVNNDYFDFLIFTSKDILKGSVFLLKPKTLNNNLVVFSENYMGLNVSGDFFVKKGRFFMLGDASGHGIQANKSAEFIKNYFLNTIFSCSLSTYFLKELNLKLKENSLRSAVLCTGEITHNKIHLCGVGNIETIYKENNTMIKKSFNNAIVGETVSSVAKYSYDLTLSSKIFIFSDGIDEEKLYNINRMIDDIYLIVVCGVFYSKRVDDKIILAIKG